MAKQRTKPSDLSERETQIRDYILHIHALHEETYALLNLRGRLPIEPGHATRFRDDLIAVAYQLDGFCNLFDDALTRRVHLAVRAAQGSAIAVMQQYRDAGEKVPKDVQDAVNRELGEANAEANAMVEAAS